MSVYSVRITVKSEDAQSIGLAFTSNVCLLVFLSISVLQILNKNYLVREAVMIQVCTKPSGRESLFSRPISEVLD